MNIKDTDLHYILNTYARNYVNFTHGKNATLYSEEKQDYIDFTSGIGVVSIGHSHPALAKAICDSAQNLIHISNLYAIAPQAKLAQKLSALSGFDTRTFFANSGAEANEGAIKMARKYGEVNGEVKRYKIITLDQSFHGRTITALKATGQEAMHNYFGPFPDGFVYAKNIDEIESLIDSHTVGVMIELIQGEGGVEPQDKAKVQALAQMLKQKDILLIVDEVQTGVYRTGEFLASNLYEIEPDIITLAKGLGGGVPIGAIMTTHKDILGIGEHGSTFGGNFLSSSAALAVLETLERYDTQPTIKTFDAHLQAIFDEFGDLFESVVGSGLMRALRAKNSDIQANVINKAFEKGVLVLKAGRNAVRFLPALTITNEEMELGFERLREALKEL